jgi:spore maturation protein CgeB
VNVCISNGLIFQGAPSKFIDCVASGGFALVDYKPDLLRLFGDVVAPVLFRDGDELNAKIEYFVNRREERRELVHELRRVIVTRCTQEALYTRVLERVLDGSP